MRILREAYDDEDGDPCKIGDPCEGEENSSNVGGPTDHSALQPKPSPECSTPTHQQPNTEDTILRIPTEL